MLKPSYRFVARWLFAPLLGAAAVCFALSFVVPDPWRSLLVNMAAAFIGSIITVFYIDAVLKRRQQLEWEGVRVRTNGRLSKLGNSGVTTVRTALNLKGEDIFDFRAYHSGDLVAMHSECIRVADSVLPFQMHRLFELDNQGWRSLTINLRNLALGCDQLLNLFGRDLDPELTKLILDIENVAESAMMPFTVFPDLMGVSDAELPLKRDGGSSIQTRDAYTKLTCDTLSRLCTLCASLLRKLPAEDSLDMKVR